MSQHQGQWSWILKDAMLHNNMWQWGYNILIVKILGLIHAKNLQVQTPLIQTPMLKVKLLRSKSHDHGHSQRCLKMPSCTIFFFFFFFNYYAPVSQANWCNMTFTAGNLFPSHLCIGWPKSSPHQNSNPGPKIERQMTYPLCYPSPLVAQSYVAMSYNIKRLQLMQTENWHGQLFYLYSLAPLNSTVSNVLLTILYMILMTVIEYHNQLVVSAVLNHSDLKNIFTKLLANRASPSIIISSRRIITT